MWCICLIISNLLIDFLIGTLLQLKPDGNIWPIFGKYAITTVLTILASVPIAYFAIWGKGYLAPLGFVCLTVVIAQIMTAIGYGTFFPWAIPALYSGAEENIKPH